MIKKKFTTTKHTKAHGIRQAFSMLIALTMAMSTFTLPTGTITAEAANNEGSIKIIEKDNESKKDEAQGDGSFSGVTYQITNNSGTRINWKGVWYNDNTPITTVTTHYDAVAKVYAAQIDNLPYGTYTVKEKSAPTGYKATVADRQVVIDGSEASGIYSLIQTQTVMRGGVSITKADADLGKSTPQGDAVLNGVEYEIVNRSNFGVYFAATNKTIEPGDVVTTITTAYDNTTQTYVASTGNNKLPYGTYEIRESKASTGYTKSEDIYKFSITNDGQMHYFDNQGETVSDTECHHGWNADEVIRGDVLVGKRDRDTAQYINLGGAHLDGAIFEIVNKSRNPVYVNGELFDVDDVVLTIASDEVKREKDTIYAALSGDKVLPYGNYRVYETHSGDGYLYDNTSKAWKQDFRISEDGEVVEITSKEIAAYNKAMREDWHFIKKTEGGDALANVAFVVESMTTGERHVIVTNEAGAWGSANNKHTDKTNSNDPTSPITNGAIAVDENGEWYVADESKLDSEAGTWFTGFAEDKIEWSEDGTSYSVKDVKDLTLNVKDDTRAFPYDTYKVQELRSEANANFDLVNFTVKLHRYSKDHNGDGIDLDFGTVTDKWVAIATTLTNDKGVKVAQGDAQVKLVDKVLYENLDVNHEYTLNGELHLVNEDGEDEGVVATAEKKFTTKTSINTVDVEFDVDTKDMGGKKLVAFETLMDGTDKVTSHEDIEDKDQTVLVPTMKTAIAGDLGHMVNANKDIISLTDVVDYKGVEAGKTYEIKGALVNQETGEPIQDKNGKDIVTTAKFVAEKSSGTVNVNFNFAPSKTLTGTTAVVTETLTLNDVEYISHNDLNDENQIVRFPKVLDNATDSIDEGKDMAEAVEQSIKDVIDVAALDEDYEYELVGELYLINSDGTNAGKLLNDKGETYLAKATWKGAKPDKALVFENVDASKLGGFDIAVIPTLYGKRIADTKTDADTTDATDKSDNKSDDKSDEKSDDDPDPDADKNLLDILKNAAESLLNKGTDKADEKTEKAKEETDNDAIVLYSTLNTSEEQLVHIPHIDTVFVTEKGTHSIDLKNETKLLATDTISYKNLIPGKEYSLNGSLHTWKVDKKNVTDGGLLKLDRGTSEVTGTFVPEKKDGTVDVVYTFDGDLSKLKGQTVTAFETVSAGNKSLAKHEDITDEDQTVRFVDMDTVLTAENGMHETAVPAKVDKTVTLSDLVTYKGLVPNQVYTLVGTLQLADETAEAKAEDKKEETTEAKAENDTDETADEPDVEILESSSSDKSVATATIVFRPTTVDGQIEVPFTFDASQFAGKTVVASEVIMADGKEVLSHKHMSDEDQMVHFTDVATEAVASNGLHIIQATEEAITVTDTVSYKNLTPGTKYTIVPSLHIQTIDKDGIAVDGGEVKLADKTSSVEFTPKASEGTETVTFKFNGLDIKDKTVVVFEQIQKNGVTVAAHEDISDEAQAIHLADITTKATFEDGSKDMKLPKTETEVAVKDVITYTNLIPGKEYTAVGELHVRSVGKEKVEDEGALANSDGSAVTATVKFTPESANGSAEVLFKFASTGLRGNTLVVFETISVDGKEIIKHHDITDDEQAISFAGKKVKADKTKKNDKKNSKKKSSKKSDSSKGSASGSNKKAKAGKEVVKTGQISHYIFFGVLGLVLMAGAGFMFFRKKL